ncbi:MAG: hypothetical protein GWN00_19995 [Aliifodinibius sp.]|nr:hypothetical protein [Fodinibius sp.]NIY27004.1 hypothetical protein [Fodinibius sp.]
MSDKLTELAKDLEDKVREATEDDSVFALVVVNSEGDVRCVSNCRDDITAYALHAVSKGLIKKQTDSISEKAKSLMA